VINPLTLVADRNLRLAIIEMLTDMQLLPPFGTGDEDRGYEYNDDVAEALLGTEVTAGQCAAVRDLYWEAGNNEIIPAILPYWSGETDEFLVESLDGLAAAVPDLETLSITLCAINDLSPLSGCTKLRELALDGLGPVTDLSPLAGLTSLRKLELNHLLDMSRPDVLQPVAGLQLEHISLGTGPKRVVDFAPLEHMMSLRILSFQRTVRISGSEPPVATAFGNARVIEVLTSRGVDVQLT
jgi:hypothetical protein